MPLELLKTAVRAVVPRAARNWLRSPSRSAEWLWDSARFSVGVTRTLQLPRDWSLVCHPHAYKIAYRDQILDPEQSEEFRDFLSHCTKEIVLFDIGAHFGMFSLAAAHFGGKAVAVDPSSIAKRMIATQAALNGSTKSIQIIQAAVSDTNGVMGLLSSGVFSDGYLKVAKGRSKRELTQTKATTVDQLVHEFGVPTHLKVDVEGHEAAVLRGARETLYRFSPLIFLELHNEMVVSEGGDPNSALDELTGLGYETFQHDGTAINRADILSWPIVRVLAKRIGSLS
jgi:FkbM family methyltransferase